MLFYIIIGIIAGVIGANMAKSRNQNPALWFVIGFVLPIAILGLLFIEKVNTSEKFIDTINQNNIQNTNVHINENNSVENSEEIYEIIEEVKEVYDININEDNDSFIVSFKMKNIDSWNAITETLLNFYKKNNVNNIMIRKENHWMINDSENKGYVEGKLVGNIITIKSFKLQKPDIKLFEKEATKKEIIQKKKVVKENLEVNIDIEIDKLYEKAWDEIEKEVYIKRLWIKAFTESDGDAEKQKSIYIKLRSKELEEELKQQAREERRKIEEEKLKELENSKEFKLENFLKDKKAYVAKTISDSELIIAYGNSPIEDKIIYLNEKWLVQV